MLPIQFSACPKSKPLVSAPNLEIPIRMSNVVQRTKLLLNEEGAASNIPVVSIPVGSPILPKPVAANADLK